MHFHPKVNQSRAQSYEKNFNTLKANSITSETALLIKDVPKLVNLV